MHASRQPSVLLSSFLAIGVFCLLSLGAQEAEAKSKAKQSKPTVAVLYFDHNTNNDDLAFLRKGVAQMLVTDLSSAPDIVLVERMALEAVLSELKLNRSNKIDRRTAIKIGNLLGARYLVTGSYMQHPGSSKLQVEARIIDTSRGTNWGFRAIRDSSDFIEIVGELAGKIEIGVSQFEEKRALRLGDKRRARNTLRTQKARTAKRTAKAANQASPVAKAKTSKIKATTIARYGKALDSLDQGHKKEAAKELAALTADFPSFQPAAEDLEFLLR